MNPDFSQEKPQLRQDELPTNQQNQRHDFRFITKKKIFKNPKKTLKANFGGEDEFSGSRKNVKMATYRAKLD